MSITITGTGPESPLLQSPVLFNAVRLSAGFLPGGAGLYFRLFVEEGAERRKESIIAAGLCSPDWGGTHSARPDRVFRRTLRRPDVSGERPAPGSRPHLLQRRVAARHRCRQPPALRGGMEGLLFLGKGTSIATRWAGVGEFHLGLFGSSCLVAGATSLIVAAITGGSDEPP